MSGQLWYRRGLPLALAVSIWLPALAQGQGIQPHVPLSTTLGDIAKVRAAYVDAYNAKNAAAVSAMYTADAVVLDADGSETVGARAIGQRNADSVRSWPQASVHSSSVKVYGATAVDVGTWTVRTAAHGDAIQRYLAVLRHDVHGWKLMSVAVVPVPR
ncbi:MAG TPA: nuclear transport factor 2 family protein [Gemmatimonadales bacterium]|jgi:ketosteroid isomerase-like protein